jgi:hypothetical protein
LFSCAYKSRSETKKEPGVTRCLDKLWTKLCPNMVARTEGAYSSHHFVQTARSFVRCRGIICTTSGQYPANVCICQECFSFSLAIAIPFEGSGLLLSVTYADRMPDNCAALESPNLVEGFCS